MKGVILIYLSMILSYSYPGMEESNEDYDAFCRLAGRKLDSSNLYRVIEKVGSAEISVSGDASEYSKRVAYFFEKEGCYVIFEVGEMGGDSTIITYKVAESRPKERFSVLKNVRFNPTDLGGIRVGMQKEEVGRKLGTKVVALEDTLTFGAVRKIPMSPEAKLKLGAKASDDIYWDKSFGFVGIFRNNRLVSFCVSQVATY